MNPDVSHEGIVRQIKSIVFSITTWAGTQLIGKYALEINQARIKPMGDGERLVDKAGPNDEDGLLNEDGTFYDPKSFCLRV